MKVDVFKKEVMLLSVTDLQKKLDQMRKQLFDLRLNSSVNHLKDYSHFSKLRANIARILTLLCQKNSVQK